MWCLIVSTPDCLYAVPGSNPASLNLQEHVSWLALQLQVVLWGASEAKKCKKYKEIFFDWSISLLELIRCCGALVHLGAVYGYKRYYVANTMDGTWLDLWINVLVNSIVIVPFMVWYLVCRYLHSADQYVPVHTITYIPMYLQYQNGGTYCTNCVIGTTCTYVYDYMD